MASIKDGKIYQMTEYDMLFQPKVPGNYYACWDSYKLYYDKSTTERIIKSVSMVSTEVDRVYNIRPNDGITYYIWETNELWFYNAGWELLIGEKRDSSGYYYDTNGITGTLDAEIGHVIDNNGLLGDGSVVVRDINRIIKGKMYIDGTSNELVFSSYLGGGIDFLPNGSLNNTQVIDIKTSDIAPPTIKSREIIASEHLYSILVGEPGTLRLNPTNIITDSKGTINERMKGVGLFNGQLNTTDDIYVNIKSIKNPSDLSIHHYKVWHQGNFDPNDYTLTPQKVLDALHALPQPIDINVDKLDGLHADAFALKQHTHLSKDITDFIQTTQTYLNKVILNGGNDGGITALWDDKKQSFYWNARAFYLQLSSTNGISGGGTVSNLTDTVLNVVMDASKHTAEHNMSDLADYSAEIKKIDDKINTRIPKTDATTAATANKLLYLNSSGMLPASITGNSASSDKWKTPRQIKITGDATSPEYTIDGTKDISIDIDVIPERHKHTEYVTKVDEDGGTGDVGKIVAPLDSDQYVPLINLNPRVKDTLQYQGTFNPATGAPAPNPLKGQYWVSTGTGNFSGHKYGVNDWAVYNGIGWNFVDNQKYVESINGSTDPNIEITPDNIGAIPKSYIEYTLPNVPSGKIVLTDSDNHVSVTAKSADRVNNSITPGDHLLGSVYDGSTATKWNVECYDTPTANKISKYDYAGNINTKTITSTINDESYIVGSIAYRTSNSSGSNDLKFCSNKDAIRDYLQLPTFYLQRAGDSVSDNTMNGSIVFSDSGTSFRGIRGAVAGNDMWRVGGAGTSSDSGYLEIATGDNSNEPIYVRQYGSGSFSSLTRSMTLLDESGNTVIPGNLYKSSSSNMYQYMNLKSSYWGYDSLPWFRTGSSGLLPNDTYANGARSSIGSSGWEFNNGYFKSLTLNGNDLQSQLNLKAPIASPSFTGTPTAPTPSAATNSTQIATTAYVKAQNSYNYIQELGANVNLNDLTGRGYYHQSANAEASTSLNYPANKAGLLFNSTDGYKYQTYQTYDGSDIYFRSYYQSWSSWKKLATSGEIPSVPVTSVNGMTGAVTINKSHVGLSNVDNAQQSQKAWWNWSGQSGQPTWLWGGNSENAYYVYNPSNFSVASAAKLTTARNIAISGAVTGNANFDGSGNISISTSVNHTHNYAGSSSAGGAATSANKVNSSLTITLSDGTSKTYNGSAAVSVDIPKSGNKTYVSSSQPSGLSNNDLWFKIITI